MKTITAGDLLHTYGGVVRGNYSVRLCVRMDDVVDEDTLKHALEDTQKRYPYLCLRMRKNDVEYYYEENNEPVCLMHTKERICLNSEETNYHVWAVSYEDDFIYLEFFHGICDGTGMYFVLSTLLYYYLREKYGSISSDGIRTLEDEIDEREYMDPADRLPVIDPSMLPKGLSSLEPAFSLVRDAKMTKMKNSVVRDVIIPEKELLKFTSANDASPGTFITLIIARAIDRINPEREKDIVGGYVINGRPMLDFPYSHHNCVNSTRLKYSDKIKKMPFDRQCTAYRGMTFLQSDKENVKRILTASASRAKMVLGIPTLEGRKEAFSKMMMGGPGFFTYIVSYVGQWKHKEIGAHIREFWTHIPDASGLITEISAVNNNIFLSIQQGFEEDIYYRAILQELTDTGIPYTERATMINDTARFKEP